MSSAGGLLLERRLEHRLVRPLVGTRLARVARRDLAAPDVPHLVRVRVEVRVRVGQGEGEGEGWDQRQRCPTVALPEVSSVSTCSLSGMMAYWCTPAAPGMESCGADSSGSGAGAAGGKPPGLPRPRPTPEGVMGVEGGGAAAVAEGEDFFRGVAGPEPRSCAQGIASPQLERGGRGMAHAGALVREGSPRRWRAAATSS